MATARAKTMPTHAPMWLQMGDDDRVKYGGPEWVVFDVAVLYHMPSSELEEFEARMPIRIAVLIAEYLTLSARSTRAALFVGRIMAGVKDEKWENFDPKTVQVFRSKTDPTAKSNGTGPATVGKAKRTPRAASPRGSTGAASAKS